MSTQRYRYAIALYRTDGTCVEQVPVAVDWEPALWPCGSVAQTLSTSTPTCALCLPPPKMIPLRGVMSA